MTDSFLKVLEEREHQMKEAGIGKDENFQKSKDIRSDKIVWIEPNEHRDMDSHFFPALNELILLLNRRCFLGINNSEFHFAKYVPGTYYKRHRDAFSNDDSRKISVVAYLNKNWKKGDGGELNLYTENETITVEPKAGTIVIFESHLEHEVLQSNTERFSITGWLRNEKLKM
ncbi:MAG: putative proline hydroxylase [Bacteroidetes bacterium]|nr:putative proline hydroxylase [Bacteroidota bacterium]